MAAASYTFFVVGDPQVGHDEQEARMDVKLQQIKNHADPEGRDICIIPGDLTQHGTGPVNNCFVRYFCMCVPYRKARDESVPDRDQLAVFKDSYWKPIRERCKRTYVCIGNHDTLITYWTGKQPVNDFITKQHGGGRYVDLVDDAIYVVSLGEYPTEDNIAWLERQLASMRKRPVVLFFHFNLYGPFSDWWSDENKERLSEVLEPIKERVAFIAVGHHHSSYTGKWKDFNVVNGSGSDVVRVKVDVEQQRDGADSDDENKAVGVAGVSSGLL